MPRPRRALVALLGFAVLVLAPVESFAQARDVPAPFSLATVGLKGTLTFKNFSHFHETDTDHEHFRDEGILQLEWAPRVPPWAILKLVVDARDDDDHFTDGLTFQVQETTRQRSLLNLKEALLGARARGLEVTVGRQIFAWGTADAYNPTDLINPYDYLDPVDNEKIGVYSAAARLTQGASSLTFVLVPVFTPSREPLPGSRWTPSIPAGFAIVDHREVPGTNLANMEYAARLRTTLRGVDVSASYFDGFERTPVLRQSMVPIAPGLALPRFTPLFSRIKALGADVSTTWSKFEFHAEGAARFVEASGRSDRFQSIGGLNHTLDIDRPWLQQIVFFAEYAHEVVLSTRTRSNIIEPAQAVGLGEGAAFRDAAVARAQVKFTEETSLKLTEIVDFVRSPNHFTQLKLFHKLTDTLHVETGLDFFAGEQQSIWGRWRDNDRFFFTMSYFF
jgi:hypothetical protein